MRHEELHALEFCDGIGSFDDRTASSATGSFYEYKRARNTYSWLLIEVTLAISKCLKLLVWLQGWGELLDLVSLSRVFLLFGRAESQSIRVARSTVSLAG